MLEPVAQHVLETLFYKKIMLYNDLLDCLKREREHLISMDLKSLWEISREKESLCEQLTSVRQEICSAANGDNAQQAPSLGEILAIMPEKKKIVFQELSHTLGKLKGEVEAFRRENMHYVDDSLQFIDEMIAIITGEAYTRDVYDHKCRLKKTANRLLLRGEV